LLGATSSGVQQDRVAAVRRLARSAKAVVVLKGASSLISSPSGPVAVNPTGSPLMATAGSGDVLTGAVGALLAQGLAPERAAIAGAYVHGLAGEILEGRLGDAGLLSAELADALPSARRAARSAS
ncbi:MAG TPA: ADP/ATP-dependent (S)-NAD(P)H-hydrate dehydratase, partial [Thermoanaerobaculia bacterium]|nr:ADP/ATP-dependent (S)-NAD(P)H-hydrate dehydratase [Thermoanaerobaculia bacterium]